MAVNGNPGPDLNQILQQLQQSAQQGTQGKPIPLLGFLSDVNVGSGLTIQGRGMIGFDAKVMPTPQRNPGLLAKIGASIRDSIAEDCKKAVQGVNAVYSGDLPSGSLPGSGDSFSAIAQSHSSGGPEIG